MKICLHLGFEIGEMDIHFPYYFITTYIRFEPKTFTYKYKTSVWNNDKFLKIVKNQDYDKFLSASDHKGSIVFITKTGNVKPHIAIKLIQVYDNEFISDIELNHLLSQCKGLIYLYIYNDDYITVQSEIFENNLEGSNIPDELLKTIAKTPYKLGVFDNKEYDTRFNPGRKVLSNSLWLVAAWKMYLGEHFFKFVPREKVLNFKHAEIVKELPDKTVFVQLFKNIDESHSPESMFSQWKWQELIDYESL